MNGRHKRTPLLDSTNSLDTNSASVVYIDTTRITAFASYTHPSRLISRVQITFATSIFLTADSRTTLLLCPQHRRQATGRSEAKRRARLLALRLPGVRGRADDLEEPRVAQTVLQLRRVPPFLGLDEPERRPGRGHLLPRLLQPKLRPQRRGLRHGSGHLDDGLIHGPPLRRSRTFAIQSYVSM